MRRKSALLVALTAAFACAGARGATSTGGPRYVELTREVALKSIEGSRRVKSSNVAGKRTVLTLENCKALAAQRSLALAQLELEAEAKDAISDSYKAQQFPRIIGSGELSSRNHFYFSFSDVLGRNTGAPGTGGGTGVDQFARSRDLGTWRYSFESRWSPTDAALAHFLMKNAENDRTKDRLLRVRVGQKLMGVVEAGFYRLLSLNQVVPMVRELVKSRDALARQTARLFKERLAVVEDLHRANQKLTASRGLLASLEAESELQREYLASAMRVGPETLAGDGFALSGTVTRPRVVEEFPELERKAIEFRPEAYQAGLDHLNASNDVKRTQIKNYPKLTGFGRYTKDIDRHLLNNDYLEYGTYMYFDVVDWVANRQERRAAKSKVARTRSEIESVALGIATQVREAGLRYRAAVAEEANSRKLYESSQRLHEIVSKRVEVGAQSKLQMLEAQGDLMHERIAHVRAAGEASARQAELAAAVGSNFSEGLPRD